MADRPVQRRHLSLAEVRALGQDSPHLAADPTYARLLLRRVSPYLTYLVTNYTHWSADVVTVLSVSAGVAGGLLVAIPSLPANLLAVVMLQLACLLDLADGEVARVRGTASRRGTYLDLVGHFIQNRALYGAGGYVLMVEAGFAPWAVLVALLGVAFASPFGEQARLQVLGTRPPEAETVHGRLELIPLEVNASPVAIVYWAYRRVAFLWNYPASMNLWCLALVADAVRFATSPSAHPLVVPWFAAGFAGTLAARQMANAIRILRADSWKST